MLSEESMTSSERATATELNDNDRLDLHKASGVVESYAEFDAKRRVAAALAVSAATGEVTSTLPTSIERVELKPHQKIKKLSLAVVKLRQSYDEKYISLSDEELLSTDRMFDKVA